MAYTLRLAESAGRALKKLPHDIRARVSAKIEALATDPFPAGVKKLQGQEDTYRFRVGDYRVVYEVHGSILLIVVLRIGHRSEIYRGLQIPWRIASRYVTWGVVSLSA